MSYIQKFNKFVEAETVKKEENKTKKVTETVEPPEEQLKAQFQQKYTEIQTLTTKIQQAESQLAIDKKNLQTLETDYVKALSDARAKLTQQAQTPPPTTPA